MWTITTLIVTMIIVLSAAQSTDTTNSKSSTEVQKNISIFLREYDREASEMCNRVANAEWKHATNTTDFNKRRMQEQQSIAAKFECLSWRRAYSINASSPLGSDFKRQVDRILNHGHCGLGEVKYMELNHVVSLMQTNYKNAKICPFVGDTVSITPLTNERTMKSANYVTSSTTYCDLKLDPDINRVMQRSRSEPELRYAWTAWRDKTGPPIRNTFMRYIDLVNQAAKFHGFSDAGDQMRSLYDDKQLYFTVQDLWHKVQPLYRNLFTYVRRGLIRYYGEEVIRNDGPIPAHLLGSMWAQNWKNIMDLAKYEPQETPDITGELVRQGYTPLRVFQAAEEFFTSLGLPPMLPEFWRNSMLQKPNEVFTDCKPSAWDFCNNVDFRIKQCTQVTIEDYINSHHEMTHVQYYMQYSGQPFVYRDGPNAAFHEAVANAIGLSVAGPVHLQKIGLLPKSYELSSGNSMINIEFLLSMALDKLPLMASSLSLEKWRWETFEKGPVGMNTRWWDLKLRYQGIVPPVARTSEHFDPGAKYQIISDEDYIKYFLATVLQFQIFAELCQASHHTGPLHTCDIYRSRDAGRILIDFMQKGASLPADQLLKIITRGKVAKISVDPLLEYFRPLEGWLEAHNRNEKVIGWNSNMDDVALYQPLQSSAENLPLKLFPTLLALVIYFCLTLY